MKKKFTKFVIAVLMVFIIYIIFWFIAMNAKYSQFTSSVEKNDLGIHYYIAEDRTAYYVKKPEFLTYTGNLVVSVDHEEEIEGVYNLGHVRLFIWSSFFTDTYKYGAMIIEDDETIFVDLDSQLKAIDSKYDALVQKQF